MENLNDYCAEGTTYSEKMIQTSETVSLRVITFSGPEEKNYPDVVFVAGWVSLMEGWREVLKEMTKYHRVIYIETREKISSKINGNAEYDVTSIGDDIVFLINHFKYKAGEYILFALILIISCNSNPTSENSSSPIVMFIVEPMIQLRFSITGFLC